MYLSKIKFCIISAIGIVSLVVVLPSSFATSRLGIAEIRQVEGYPCFTIPMNGETRSGVPLYGIFVKEDRMGGPEELAKDVWTSEDLSFPPKTRLHPERCIRYGENINTHTQSNIKPLELYKIYYVSIIAKEEESNVISYVANFCITSDQLGRRKIQMIPRDNRLGEARFNVCNKLR
jgi:hypothetical protein